MKKELQKMRFATNFEVDSDNEDSRFKKVKVWVAHTKWNLNKSYFSEELLETMAQNSLAHIPITGFVEQTDESIDFAGHEEIIVLGEDGVEFKYLGVPIGFIPKENNYAFEEKDGKMWLTVEGIVWNKFETSNILGDNKGHSMELLPSDLEGKYEKDFDGDTGWVMETATFDALCVLGDTHTPAMAGSIIETFSSNFSSDVENKTFATEMKEMLKEYTSYIKGGEKVKKEEKFELTNDQIRDLLYAQLDNEGIYCYGVKYDSTVVYYSKNWTDLKLYGANYSLVKDEVTIDFDTEEEYIMQPVLVKDVNFEINNSMIKSITKVTTEKFTSEIDELKSNHTVELESKMSEKDDTIDGLNATLKDLETFKNSALETQRKKYVDSVENLSKEEKDGLVEKINEYTMETLEKEVALIVGRNALKFTTESDEVILDTVNNDGLEKDFTENDENSQYKGKSYESLIK
jgi:uncharacterized coiled-coil protein SlyX